VGQQLPAEADAQLRLIGLQRSLGESGLVSQPRRPVGLIGHQPTAEVDEPVIGTHRLGPGHRIPGAVPAWADADVDVDVVGDEPREQPARLGVDVVDDHEDSGHANS